MRAAPPPDRKGLELGMNRIMHGKRYLTQLHTDWHPAELEWNHLANEKPAPLVTLALVVGVGRWDFLDSFIVHLIDAGGWGIDEGLGSNWTHHAKIAWRTRSPVIVRRGERLQGGCTRGQHWQETGCWASAIFWMARAQAERDGTLCEHKLQCQ